MRKPFKKNISDIPMEDAHDGSGSRQVLLDENDAVSSQFQAATKGFLKSGNCYDWHDHKAIDEMWIVLDGEGFIEYKDGTKFSYKKDDIIYNPAELSHKIVAEGSTDSIYYFIRFNS